MISLIESLNPSNTCHCSVSCNRCDKLQCFVNSVHVIYERNSFAKVYETNSWIPVVEMKS
jgi:hypothetical protein